jgi:hypothetical protein
MSQNVKFLSPLVKRAAAECATAKTLIGERIFLIIAAGAGIVLPIGFVLFVLWSM